MLRKAFFLSLVFSAVLPVLLHAQQFQFRPNAFGANVFAGGIDTPRYQLVDIDGDGDMDFMALDRDEMLWFYRNENGTFVLEPFQSFGLTVGSWFRFVDIDADGDYDCFTNGEFSEVSLYTNTGSSTSPHFQLTEAAMADTNGIDLFSERFSVPAFADIDGDGDCDFFTGSQSGSVTLYENVGDAHQPRFAFITNEFNGIQIIGGGANLRKAQHGASAIEFFDADSNGTLDLFWGDYFNPSMYFLKNIGTAIAPNYILTDSTYPKGNEVLTFGYNIPQHVDMDGDGKTDLIVSTVFPTEGYDNLWHFKNIGTNQFPEYSLQTKNMIPMIDGGSRSSVAVADYDGDGDQDICLATGGGEIRIYVNTGSAHAALFSKDPALTISLPSFYCTAGSGDLDGDGDADLLIGDFAGSLRFFRNSSMPGQLQFDQQPFQLDTISAGNSSAPAVGDIDHDGRGDILVGNSAGRLIFYKNIGTNAQPVYSLVSEKWNGIDAGNDASPFVTDLDKDGNTDLLIGNSDGRIAHYEYHPQQGEYLLVTDAFGEIDLKISVFPNCADVDDDGDPDLLIGSGKGGMYYFENSNVSSTPPDDRSQPSASLLSANYPNPFNPVTTIPFFLHAPAFVTLTIFDILGREIEILIQNTLSEGSHSVSWNARGFPSGIYYCRLSVLSNDRRSFFFARPMILLQ
ncbi:MAG: FG-GAP-like repeat-containing protein [Bacteroidota bacterium]